MGHSFQLSPSLLFTGVFPGLFIWYSFLSLSFCSTFCESSSILISSHPMLLLLEEGSFGIETVEKRRRRKPGIANIHKQSCLMWLQLKGDSIDRGNQAALWRKGNESFLLICWGGPKSSNFPLARDMVSACVRFGPCGNGQLVLRTSELFLQLVSFSCVKTSWYCVSV